MQRECEVSLARVNT